MTIIDRMILSCLKQTGGKAALSGGEEAEVSEGLFPSVSQLSHFNKFLTCHQLPKTSCTRVPYKHCKQIQVETLTLTTNLQGDCELHIEKDWGLNTHSGWPWTVSHVFSISYLVREQSLFHCPRFCPSIRPQTKLTRGTSLETQTLQQVELVDNSSLTQL